MTPEQISSNGIGYTLVAGGLIFLFRYFWPWFSTVYWPERQAREREQYNQLVELIDRLMNDTKETAKSTLFSIANIADAQSMVQTEIARLEEGGEKRDELAERLVVVGQNLVIGIEEVARTLLALDEDYSIIAGRIARFEELVLKATIQYLEDQRSRRSNDESRTTDEPSASDD